MTDHRAKGERALSTMVARATGQTVSAADYQAALYRLNLNHEQAASRLGVSASTSRRYAQRGAPVEIVSKL